MNPANDEEHGRHLPDTGSPTAAAPLELGAYAVHVAREGFASIVHRASGEIMHSRTPPMEEARKVYVEQADLASKLRQPGGPLVLWDVGLGAAANALAAMECQTQEAGRGPVRPLTVISFENDLDSLRLALRHRDKFSYLAHGAADTVLQDGRWQSSDGRTTWDLVHGNFVEVMDEAPGPPEVIFYDMFSPKTCGEAWQLATFRMLFAICRGTETTLCTYTLSTGSRAMMLASGFWVARGRRAGEKAETTIALTAPAVASGHALLGREWLAKWERSTAKFPGGLPHEERAAFEQSIREHPQFRP